VANGRQDGRGNILLVSDVSIARVMGGAERVLYEQSTRLAAKGHRVHVLTRRLPGHRTAGETIHGVVEWRYPVNSKNALSFIATTFTNSARLFRNLHGKHRYRSVNFHQPFSAFGVLRSVGARGVKKIYTCHSLAFEEYRSRNPYPSPLVGRLLYGLHVQGRRRAEEIALKRCDAVVTLSRFTREKLRAAYAVPPARVTVIPGGVDLDRFQPCPDKQALRARLGIPLEKTVFFTVRNLVQRMGLENLILAMHRVAPQAPDIHLVLGGEGPLRAELGALVTRLGLEGIVHFAGFIDEESLPDHYAAADCFVLPTRELEGFGLVTLESMACAVPVLGTPVGGTREILEPFGAGFLFADTGPSSMAPLIVEKYWAIKENPVRWKAISTACRQFVETHYSWDRNVEALERLLALP